MPRTPLKTLLTLAALNDPARAFNMITVSLIGNDQIPETLIAKSRLPEGYRQGKSFSLIGCGALTPFLAFCGITEDAQKVIAEGNTKHTVLIVDYIKDVNDYILYLKDVIKRVHSFDELFEAIKLDLNSSMGLHLPNAAMNDLFDGLKSRLNLLSSIFSSKAHGFQSFKTLYTRVCFEQGDWGTPGILEKAAAKKERHIDTKNIIVAASNLLEVEAVTRDNPASSVPYRRDRQTPLREKKLTPFENVLSLKPKILILNSNFFEDYPDIIEATTTLYLSDTYDCAHGKLSKLWDIYGPNRPIPLAILINSSNTIASGLKDNYVINASAHTCGAPVIALFSEADINRLLDHPAVVKDDFSDLKPRCRVSSGYLPAYSIALHFKELKDRSRIDPKKEAAPSGKFRPSGSY